MLEARFSLQGDQQRRRRGTALHPAEEHSGASSTYTAVVPAWQQRAAHRSILGKMENGKVEKNAFPALLLLLSDSLCHRAVVPTCPTVAGQGLCHQGACQR